MNWPAVIAWLLLPCPHIQGSPQKPRCEFPQQWRGSWFQLGENTVNINDTHMGGKGHCIASEGDKFLIHEYGTKEKCHRCIVMHEKHENVLQFKETECVLDKNLDSVCNQLRGDAALNSLFRINSTPSPCPFRGPMEFIYSHGSGSVCKTPPSQVEACTQESRLLLRYQACADVESTEFSDVEYECLATWKEGSSQYLVVRLNQTGIPVNENQYRCILYEKLSNGTWKLAQSGEASCNGLTNTADGWRNLQMWQKKNPVRCSFPPWLVTSNSWLALDQPAVTQLITSINNITIFDQYETQYSCHSFSTELKRTFSSYNKNPHQQVRIVTKATRNCNNGFVCLIFHKRDDHVIEMQKSLNWSHQPDEACRPGVFDSISAPYITFMSSDPKTQQCPYLGHYEVVSIWKSALNRAHVLEHSRDSFEDSVDELRESTSASTSLPKHCHHSRVSRLDIGCGSPDRMKFLTSSCKDETFSEYSCHGTWVENNTAYLVASTDVGRYCIVYSASAIAGPNSQLSVTGHLASCPRTTQPRTHEWQVNLTSSAQCGDVSSASSLTSSGSYPTTRILFVMLIIFIKYVLR